MLKQAADHGRPAVRVILGPFSSDPFAHGLRTLLTESGDFDVLSIDDLTAICRGQATDLPSILIIEGSDPAECRTYLEGPLIHSVVLFDPVGAQAFVGVDNPDWRQLAAVVKAVAGEARGKGLVDTVDRVRVIDARTLLTAHAHGVDSRALAPLVRWLELSLGLCLARRAAHDHPSVPGWSMAPREALELLNLRTSGERQRDLPEQLTAADRELIVSRETLPAAVTELAETFSLSVLELRLLCFVLAPEIDGGYATVIGVLQDDLTRRRPGLTLLAELMSQTDVSTWDLRRTVHASDSIVAKGLVRPVVSEDLAVDVGFEPSRAVMAHLAAPSVERSVAELGAALQLPAPEAAPTLSVEENELARQLELSVAEPPRVVHLVGGSRTKRWFRRLAAARGLTLIVGDLVSVEPGPGRATAVSDWLVFSRLVGSGLMVLGVDALDGIERQRVADQLFRPSLGVRLMAVDAELSTNELSTRALLLQAPTVAATERADWWSAAAARVGLPLAAGDTERLAATVTIDPDDIALSMALAFRHRAAGASTPTVELVQKTARALDPTPVPLGVRRIEPIYGWHDIVLEQSSLQLLRTIPVHVLQAGRVLEEWGFESRVPYGQGVAALFSGPSGTGKTMSAQIIAGELGTDLHQVDLSKTVSKYIGETEKNLDGIFTAAERAGAVLLFDEADAIFGKRTEIKDAHDRHANVEVAYLLQRIETFSGLAILTTNFKQNIDNAFVRRLRFVVDFVLPTAAQRELIWRKAFPNRAPIAADVDVSFLARRLQIPGGSIQNIALHAAFLAAADGNRICSSHVMTATRRELVKIGMLSVERSLDERPADLARSQPLPVTS